MASTRIAELQSWEQAEALARDLCENEATGVRLHAARALGGVARPGGCFVRLWTRGSGDHHLGAYSRNAYAYGVATWALCNALLTDESAAVLEAALDALRQLHPVGDEMVKHALLSAMVLHVSPTSVPLREAAVDLLVTVSSYRDAELVARLALMLEAGEDWPQTTWTDAKYTQLCAMLPPPGCAVLPRPLRRILADSGDALYTGRTLPVLHTPASSPSGGLHTDHMTFISVPQLSDASPGSLVGSMLLLSADHVPPPLQGPGIISSTSSGAHHLASRTAAHALGTPGISACAPHLTHQLSTQAPAARIPTSLLTHALLGPPSTQLLCRMTPHPHTARRPRPTPAPRALPRVYDM
jgi:hypothetical protein